MLKQLKESHSQVETEREETKKQLERERSRHDSQQRTLQESLSSQFKKEIQTLQDTYIKKVDLIASQTQSVHGLSCDSLPVLPSVDSLPAT